MKNLLFKNKKTSFLSIPIGHSQTPLYFPQIELNPHFWPLVQSSPTEAKSRFAHLRLWKKFICLFKCSSGLIFCWSFRQWQIFKNFFKISFYFKRLLPRWYKTHYFCIVPEIKNFKGRIGSGRIFRSRVYRPLI